MDLNQVQAPPARPRLRMVRSRAPEEAPEGFEPADVVDLPVFEGGESLSEDVERTFDEHGYPEPTEAEMEEVVDRLMAAEDPFPEPEQRWHQRLCPLPHCDSGVRVPDDGGEDVLGIGMSMAAAHELEALFTRHLESHSLSDWVGALRYYEDRMSPVNVQARPQAGEFRVEGATPGPARRDPARQAAVDAVDKRLGRGGGPEPMSAADAEAHDQRLREARARRRAKEPTPYDLTPAWRQDLESGVVGIKR